MFFILTLALFPLGLLAFLASLQAIRTADLEKMALLRVAATQSARKLSSELLSDQAALRLTVNTLASGRTDTGLCKRAETFLHARSNSDTRFAVYDRMGRRWCGSPQKDMRTIAAQRFSGPMAELLPGGQTLMMRMPSNDGRLVALTFYSRAYLDSLTDPVAAVPNRRIWLQQGKARIDVSDPGQGRSMTAGDRFARRISNQVSARIEPTDIVLTMMVHDPPVTLARALSLLLPLFMWFAAAAIVWVFVHRLLIRPLVELRRAVAGYHPGEVMEPLKKMRTPAREIAALGETFREISEDVATHEEEMAQSLERQRRLTREVHHRVKNNLQIIASLISLHARSAHAPEAIDAYASIQRRVDALSVVHRNHYAELEQTRGVGIRALVSELSASLRATSPREASGFVIQVDSDDLHVSQDVAVPIAFLITELVELAMLIDPTAIIRIAVRATHTAGRATLSVCSRALCPSDAMQDHLDRRFGRVLTGLARQLRAPLDHDEKEGVYTIEIPVSD
ncbi:sensor histidine kinase [Sphingobium aquiterrae]|uniref:sensor histidine kinase n=1 Tax=Sphingobium aquiterrae TaxID=2038656 RepID=UPI0030161C0F